MRIDPPPSPSAATATKPAATAAAEPPLDPPGVRFGSHGFRQGPNNSGSVIACSPNSGVLVLPRIDTPVELKYYRNGGILQYVLRQLLSG